MKKVDIFFRCETSVMGDELGFPGKEEGQHPDGELQPRAGLEVREPSV